MREKTRDEIEKQRKEMLQQSAVIPAGNGIADKGIGRGVL